MPCSWVLVWPTLAQLRLLRGMEGCSGITSTALLKVSAVLYAYLTCPLLETGTQQILINNHWIESTHLLLCPSLLPQCLGILTLSPGTTHTESPKNSRLKANGPEQAGGHPQQRQDTGQWCVQSG